MIAVPIRESTLDALRDAESDRVAVSPQVACEGGGSSSLTLSPRTESPDDHMERTFDLQLARRKWLPHANTGNLPFNAESQ